MSEIAEEYLVKARGNKIEASALLAVDLMRGDDATLTAGYTIGNALLVVLDQFNLTAREVCLVAERIDKKRAE